MNFKALYTVSLLLSMSSVHAITECNEKISRYFIGTSEVNGAEAHLWVNFEGGGSASVSSNSSAFNGILSTVITSVAADKTVAVRYLANNVDCKTHHADWVGLWLYK